jgi:histidine triad (HIT) family protein
MPEEQTCIFCKTVAGEMPSQKIYESDTVDAILDIAPINPGHTLVMPKQHMETLLDAPDDLLRDLMIGVKKVGRAQMMALGTTGFNVLSSVGKVAGQIVPHLHIHVVPRHAEDTLAHWPAGRYHEGEMEEMGKKIRSAIA